VSSEIAGIYKNLHRCLKWSKETSAGVSTQSIDIQDVWAIDHILVVNFFCNCIERYLLFSILM